MTRYNLPDQGSQEWYSSPLFPAVADLDRRVGDSTDTSTSLAAQIAALQTAVTTAQAAADAAAAAAAAAQTTANAGVAVKPYWFGYLATTASIPAGLSNTLITWTQDAVSGGFFYSAGVLTLPALTGRYRVTAVLYWDKSSAVGGRLCQVYSGSTGGSPLISGGTTGNTTGTTGDNRSGQSAIAHKTLQLSASAQIRVLAAQGADGGLGVLAGINLSYFQVEYLGVN